MSYRYRLREIERQYGEVLREQVREIKSREIIFNDPAVEPYRDMVVMNARHGGAIYTQDNTVELFVTGEENFSRMFADIEAATESVDVLYFIFKGRDKIGRAFLSLLARKAREGVRVRLCYDMLGYPTGRYRDFKILTDAGGQVYPYMPSVGRTFVLANYRMHRKIVIIDDAIAYTGGFNVGDEYMGEHRKKTPWRDTGIRITGTAVWLLKLRFLSDWTFVDQQHKRSLRAGRGELVREFKSRLGARRPKARPEPGEPGNDRPQPAEPQPSEQQLSESQLAEIQLSDPAAYETALPLVANAADQRPGRVGVQIVSSGPDSEHQYMRDCYMKLATSAREYLYIQSPYFVPGESLYNAIAQAAPGVDVRLMPPKIPDFPLLQAASMSYARDLMRSGPVYIYEGFPRQELGDRRWVSRWAPPMSIAKLMLNYEVNGVFYDTDFARRCRQVFEEPQTLCAAGAIHHGFVARVFRPSDFGGPLM